MYRGENLNHPFHAQERMRPVMPSSDRGYSGGLYRCVVLRRMVKRTNGLAPGAGGMTRDEYEAQGRGIRVHS